MVGGRLIQWLTYCSGVAGKHRSVQHEHQGSKVCVRDGVVVQLYVARSYSCTSALCCTFVRVHLEQAVACIRTAPTANTRVR